MRTSESHFDHADLKNVAFERSMYFFALTLRLAVSSKVDLPKLVLATSILTTVSCKRADFPFRLSHSRGECCASAETEAPPVKGDAPLMVSFLRCAEELSKSLVSEAVT